MDKGTESVEFATDTDCVSGERNDTSAHDQHHVSYPRQQKKALVHTDPISALLKPKVK